VVADEQITEDRLWKHIYDELGGHPGNTSAATCTRRIYEKYTFISYLWYWLSVCWLVFIDQY